MKLSEITPQQAIAKAKEDPTDPDIVQDFTDFLAAAKAFILSYTGLTPEEADKKPDLNIALFVLVNDMHDNRSYTVKDDKLNPTVQTILNMHSVNFLAR